MNIKTFALALCATLSATHFAQAQNAMTLKQCIDYGLKQNVSIKRAQLNLSNNKAVVNENIALYLPQVKASGSLTDNIKRQTSILPGELIGQPGTTIPIKFGTQFSMVGGINASQIIYDQTYISGISAAKESNNIFVTQTEKAEEQVIYDISTVFFQTQITAEQKKLVEANLERISQLADITKVQLENGFAKQTDYNRLVVTKSNLQTDLQNIELGYSQQLMLLKFNMGMPLDSAIELQAGDAAESLLNTSAFSPENNIDLKLLQLNKDINLTLRKRITAGYIPSLTFNVNYNYLYQADNLKFYEKGAPWTPYSAFSFNLTVPIFDGLNKHWKTQQSKIQFQQLELDEIRLRESIKLQNTNAQTQITSKTSSVNAQKNNMDLADEVYKATQVQYQQGMATLSDLLNAETSLKESQSNYLNALVQLKLAELELLKSSGNIRSVINNKY